MRARFFTVVWSLAIAIGFAVFNNCSDVSFAPAPAEIARQQAALDATSSILIENDADYTKQSTVQLKLNSPRAVAMKISNQPDCSDGNWEAYSSSKAWMLSEKNKKVQVFAKYRDFAGRESQCVTDDITHDDVPPVPRIINNPGFVTNQAELLVSWVAVDNLSGVDKISCAGPGRAAEVCGSSLSTVVAQEGIANVWVKVTDKAGNESQPVTYSWLFDKTPPMVTFNQRPATLSSSKNAEFSFSASDSASGVLRVVCQLDNDEQKDCDGQFAAANLADGNHQFRVYAIDRAGNTSEPLRADFMIDSQAPTLRFTQTPPAVSNQRSATFAFEGMDSGTAITRFECRKDNEAFAACASPVAISALGEGMQSFEVRGYDSAGNLSEPVKYQWQIDYSAPKISISAGPAALSNQTRAVFQWAAADAGSGVKTIECSLDGTAYRPCSAVGETLSVTEGQHHLVVRAVDHAGNSASAESAWKVDTTAPTVTITAGPDAYARATMAEFAFTGNDANGVASYLCRVDAGEFAACSSPHIVRDLAPGGHVLFVQAVDRAGNVSAPATRQWVIDVTPPIIQVVKAPSVLKQGDAAVVAYAAVDLGSGIDRVKCGLTSYTGALEPCDAEGEINLGTELPVGVHSFEIIATDKVGNVQSERLSFEVTARAIICDPFQVGGESHCSGGLIGEIFYLDQAKQNEFKGLSRKTVDYFYSNGIKVDALLTLRQLFVPTRSFTQGFPSTEGDLIKDNSGKTLIEYFAFRVETVLKLDAANDLPGFYQFAILSDDGSMLLTKAPSSANYDLAIVSNDGDHSTRMGCSNQAIYIDDTTRLPLMVKYYQGPRTEIALTLMWRRVSAINSPLDPSCGVSGNSAFFGPAPYNNFTTSLFAQLTSTSGGWRVIAPSNFIAPVRQ